MKYTVTLEKESKAIMHWTYDNAYIAAYAVASASTQERIDHTSILEARLRATGYCDAKTHDGGIVFCHAEA